MFISSGMLVEGLRVTLDSFLLSCSIRSSSSSWSLPPFRWAFEPFCFSCALEREGLLAAEEREASISLSGFSLTNGGGVGRDGV